MDDAEREDARQPEELSPLIVERLNAADVEGLAALYEPDAVLALPDGQVASGAEEIGRAYEPLLVDHGRPVRPGPAPPRHEGTRNRPPCPERPRACWSRSWPLHWCRSPE